MGTWLEPEDPNEDAVKIRGLPMQDPDAEAPETSTDRYNDVINDEADALPPEESKTMPFKCFCDDTFETKGELEDHLGTVHPDRVITDMERIAPPPIAPRRPRAPKRASLREREVKALESIDASLKAITWMLQGAVERQDGREFADGKPRSYLRVIAETWEQNT